MSQKNPDLIPVDATLNQVVSRLGSLKGKLAEAFKAIIQRSQGFASLLASLVKDPVVLERLEEEQGRLNESILNAANIMVSENLAISLLQEIVGSPKNLTEPEAVVERVALEPSVSGAVTPAMVLELCDIGGFVKEESEQLILAERTVTQLQGLIASTEIPELEKETLIVAAAAVLPILEGLGATMKEQELRIQGLYELLVANLDATSPTQELEA